MTGSRGGTTGGAVRSAPASPALLLATGFAGAAVVLACLLSGVPSVPAVALLLVVQVLATVPAISRRSTAATRRGVPAWVVLGASGAVAVAVGVTTRGGLALLACATVVGHHLLVRTHRDVVVSLLTTAGTSVLVLSQAGSTAVLPALAVAWAAGVAAVALRAGEARRAEPIGSAPGSAPTWRHPLRRLVWPVAASLVAVLAVGLVGLTPPSAAERLARAGGLAGQEGGQGRSTSAYVSGRLDMRVRGELPRTPVVEVPASSDRLWRAGVLGSYDGVAWSPAVVGRPSPAASDPLGLGDGDPADASARPRGVRTDAVTVLGDLGGLVLAPGRAVAVRPSGPAPVEVYGQVLVAPRSPAYEVDSVAVPEARDADAEGSAGGGAVADDPRQDAWTALPPSVTERTRALALEVTRGAETRGEVVAAVEDHLRATYAYDLGSPVPPRGQDAVDHFLFDARSGFCEQFAAAEVVLLRSLGIPARMATGFAGGEDRGDRRLVRADTAHAWVEVWQPGTGWAVSDPTPSTPEAIGVLASLTALLADRDVRRALAAALVLLFAAAALATAVRRRRRRPSPIGPAGTAGPPLLAAAERLLVALERTGRASPPGETVAAVAGRLPEVAAALAVVERAAYAGRPPAAREAIQAQEALDEATGRMLAQGAPRPS